MYSNAEKTRPDNQSLTGISSASNFTSVLLVLSSFLAANETNKMASLKLATLAIRTIAKPISSRLKQEAREHPFFRRICVQVAQSMYSAEMRLGTFVLGQPPKAIKPLSETKAIESGANFIAESFLFFVAASLIVAETWRSSLKQSRRRESVSEDIEELKKGLEVLNIRVGEVERALVGNPLDGTEGKEGPEVDELGLGLEKRVRDVEERSQNLTRVIEKLVSVNANSGWIVDADLGSKSRLNKNHSSASTDSSSPNATSTRTLIPSQTKT